jgi:hypothetical protein
MAVAAVAAATAAVAVGAVVPEEEEGVLMPSSISNSLKIQLTWLELSCCWRLLLWMMSLTMR